MLAFDQDAASKDAAALADGGDRRGNKRESSNIPDMNTADVELPNKSKHNKGILSTNPATPPGPPPGSDPLGDPETGSRIKTKDVVNLLLKFAGFLTRSQGDIESADLVYKKALEVSLYTFMYMWICMYIQKKKYTYVCIYT